MIAIKVCEKEARLSHKINYDAAVDCDFYSKELLEQLGTVSPDLIAGYTYRLTGKVHKKRGLAIFHMDKSSPVCDIKQ